MTIGILRLLLFIPHSNSLKDKRMVLHSLKAKLRNHFNIAVTQLDDEDKWQRTTLAVVGVEKNKTTMNRTLSEIINYIRGFNAINLIDYEMELI
ncbi:MAG: DUF503 domain-containing protein [Candidatus Omnitrophica bacterium]|nr:DUF503 domain-containing protein [Candidatus Omnitrophota bacterium]